MKPIFEQVALELGNTINFLSIDVELKKKIARRYNVKSVPTFILFKNGESIWRQLGVLQKDDIIYAIAQFI
jgi:thioredoxin 1